MNTVLPSLNNEKKRINLTKNPMSNSIFYRNQGQ